MKNMGMYIHIPFCKQKCIYCDFKSYANKEKYIEKYIKFLKQELAEVGEGNKLDYKNKLDDLVNIKTIYIGGGTPSFIDSKLIVDILNTVKQNYVVDENAEITIEVNPGTVTEEKLKDYINCGINRISIGLQSTKENLLKQLGRIHTYSEFKQTYELARKVGFENINVDLMLGIPNQTIKELEESLSEIILLKPEHISVYSLIVEEDTPLYLKIQNKELVLPEEELERKMYWTTKKILEQNDYEHYEISNFAQKGFRAKHNTDCWEQEEYMGFGVAAHSYTNNVRFSNIDSVEEYIQNFEKNKQEDNLIFHEKQNISSKMKEYMLLGLRMLNGVCIQKFKAKFGENPIYLFRKELEKLVNEELVQIDGDFIKLTNKGLDLANVVWEGFV